LLVVFIGRVDHFRAGILVLTVTRQSDADHLAAGFAPFQHHARIFSSSALNPILQSIHLIFGFPASPIPAS